MAAANNATDYANARIGIYFPGFPSYLTGQCVSLVKWYIGEMCGVADWQAARGNAKDFGDTLVSQGLADLVTTPQRGDIAVWKQDGGGYGHIGVVLDGGNVFEENVGLAGSPSEVVDGITVFPSRVDSMGTPWRIGAPTFYRMHGYHEVTPPPATSVAADTGLVPAKGTATVTVNTLNVRNAPDTNSAIVATYSRGQSFNYDSYQVANGYVWLSYVNGAGVRRFIAEGPNDGNSNNVFVSGGVA